MCENNERYDSKTVRWIQKINAMHVNRKDKWYMKKNLFKNLEIENFSVSIDRIPIELSRFYQKIVITISISWETAKIDRKSGKLEFWKTEQFNAETP